MFNIIVSAAKIMKSCQHTLSFYRHMFFWNVKPWRLSGAVVVTVDSSHDWQEDCRRVRDVHRWVEYHQERTHTEACSTPSVTSKVRRSGTLGPSTQTRHRTVHDGRLFLFFPARWVSSYVRTDAGRMINSSVFCYRFWYYLSVDNNKACLSLEVWNYSTSV